MTRVDSEIFVVDVVNKSADQPRVAIATDRPRLRPELRRDDRHRRRLIGVTGRRRSRLNDVEGPRAVVPFPVDLARWIGIDNT